MQNHLIQRKLINKIFYQSYLIMYIIINKNLNKINKFTM